MKKSKNNIVLVLFICFFIVVGSLLKFGLIVGSYKTFFSAGVNIFMPLLGAFTSIPFAGLFITLFFLTKKMFLGGLFTLGIPSFFASLCWNLMLEKDLKNSFIKNILSFGICVLLPLICICLFCYNSVGRFAYVYSFYWFIPIVFYFLYKFNVLRSFFSIAIISTFIAHCVGSIMWLYFVPMTSEQWLSLVPVVAIERTIFAFSMTSFYYVSDAISVYFKTKIKIFAID